MKKVTQMGRPFLFSNQTSDKTGDYSEARSEVEGPNGELTEGCTVEYRVAILTDMEEELASRDVPHSGTTEEKCRFSDDDFSTLSEDALDVSQGRRFCDWQ